LKQARIKPHICESLAELCSECRVKVPSDAVPKLTWVSVSDRVSAIPARTVSHPFAFFEQDVFDAVQSCYNRTTTPPNNGKSNNPPFQVGTPSHINRACKGSCNLITTDAWVDFNFCAPISGSQLEAELLKDDKLTSKTVDRFKAGYVYFHSGGRAKVRFCQREDLDITAQLWTALRISMGHKW
jgi:hypothetical protein